MTKTEIVHIKNELTKKGIVLDSGLSNKEIVAIELQYAFNFPPDLKELLTNFLPVSERFPNWRKSLVDSTIENSIKDKMYWPFEGMLFDIENNEFWIEEWGKKPNDEDQRKNIAFLNYNTYPKLIPIYSHRYIPSEPNEAMNPIFSVHQMDIIYYGTDLFNYFVSEFALENTNQRSKTQDDIKPIRFWGE